MKRVLNGEPAQEGELELKAARLNLSYAIDRVIGDVRCNSAAAIDQQLWVALDNAIAAERADAARQERRRTLEEVRERAACDSDAQRIWEWLNERIRETASATGSSRHALTESPAKEKA
jgi:hypothetical protein